MTQDRHRAAAPGKAGSPLDLPPPELASLQTRLVELAERLLRRAKAGGVAIRTLDADGAITHPVALVGGRAARRTLAEDEPTPTTRTRWLARPPSPGAVQNYPVRAPSGRLLGWLAVDASAGPLDQALAAEYAELAGALIDNAVLSQLLSRQRDTVEAISIAKRNAELAFDLAFDESVIGMSLISLDQDTAGQLLRVNDSLCRLTGYSAPQLLALTFSELSHPEDRQLGESALRRAIRGRRTPFDYDKRYLRADGSVIWVKVSAAPLFDDAGQPLYALSQVVDLSARGDHESEVAQRQDPLTGLLNEPSLRQSLQAAIERANRRKTSCAVLYATVDSAGGTAAELRNELQIAVAQSLGRTLRSGDIISRVSDNQFVIVTEEVDESQAAVVAQRISAALNDAHQVAGQPVTTRASLGVAVLAPGSDGESLLYEARSAMTRALERGSGSYFLYVRPAGGEPPIVRQTLYASPSWHDHRR